MRRRDRSTSRSSAPSGACSTSTRAPACRASTRCRAGTRSRGARSCTPQSCGFRDHAAELAGLGALVAGVSAQTLPEQVEFAERNHMPFPVLADPELRLRDALALPTFQTSGLTLYKRLAFVAERGKIAKVFYPVFPPDRSADEMLAYLCTLTVT